MTDSKKPDDESEWARMNSRDKQKCVDKASDVFHSWAASPDYIPLDEDSAESLIFKIAQALADVRIKSHEDGLRIGRAIKFDKENSHLSFEPSEARTPSASVEPESRSSMKLKNVMRGRPMDEGVYETAPACAGPSDAEIEKYLSENKAEIVSPISLACDASFRVACDWFRSKLRPMKLPHALTPTDPDEDSYKAGQAIGWNECRSRTAALNGLEREGE